MCMKTFFSFLLAALAGYALSTWKPSRELLTAGAESVLGLKRLFVSPALVWDAEVKEHTAVSGELKAEFTFIVTNTSSRPAFINQVHASCGCTVAKLGKLPLEVPPGTNATMNVTLNLSGKQGTVSKRVTVETSYGQKRLTVKAHVPKSDSAEKEDRSRNQQLALADRQAIFKGDCAQCHVQPATGKLSQPLYVTACGICHDSEERASVVPDLRTLSHATSQDYWRHWITYGKPGSMMPAFAQAEGGPLTDAQITSLVKYLSKEFAAPSTVSSITRARAAQ